MEVPQLQNSIRMCNENRTGLHASADWITIRINMAREGGNGVKKNHIAMGLLVMMAFATGIWWYFRPAVLGNINHASTEPETSVSTISFSGEAGDRIKLSFQSTIENGNLDIVVCDAKGTVVKELDRAKRLETFVTLDDTDTYTLEADYRDFIGNFQITVYKES